MSPSRLLEIDARRICLIKPSALGDIVQSLPLLPVLRRRFPHARVSWVVNRQYAELLRGHPDLDEVIGFERRGSWRDWLRLLRYLRSQRFDLVFDLQGLLRTAVMTRATGAKLRVGLETAREGAGLACRVNVPDTGRLVPAHLRYWRVAEALGMGDCRRVTRLWIDVADREFAREQLQMLNRPVLAIHCGARWVTKRWPVEKFAAVACKAMRNYGFSTILVGSPDEQPLTSQLAQLLRKLFPPAQVRDLAGRTTLRQLAALLGQSDVLLSNDSGPMHLAAGLGTPVAGVFTCTSRLRSGPGGSKHELVKTNLSCGASYKKRCPYRGRKHLACMDELEIERVWQAFRKLVAKNFPKDHAA